MECWELQSQLKEWAGGKKSACTSQWELWNLTDYRFVHKMQIADLWTLSLPWGMQRREGLTLTYSKLAPTLQLSGFVHLFTFEMPIQKYVESVHIFTWLQQLSECWTGHYECLDATDPDGDSLVWFTGCIFLGMKLKSELEAPFQDLM